MTADNIVSLTPRTPARRRACDELDRRIGAEIRRRRDEQGMTQSALARAVGVTFQQVQKYERGVNRVAASTLIRIAHAFGMTGAAFMAAVEVDPRTGRKPGDHGTAADALDFSVESEGRIVPELQAHIVWNGARTEGVIFAEYPAWAQDWPLSAADDAHQASTGRSRQRGIGSALAEAFYEAYEDDDERPIQTIPLAALRARSEPENDDEGRCDICGKGIKGSDICATDTDLGPCHAACLEGSPVVSLETGEELPEGSPVHTYRYEGAPLSKEGSR